MPRQRDDTPRRRSAAAIEADGERGLAMRILLHSPKDTIAGALAFAAISAIIANALFLQAGPHPAPMFTGLDPSATVSPKGSSDGARPASARSQPVAASQPSAQPRSGSDVVADIQRELAARGFFDGVVDGRHGPRTDAAVRSFAIAAGLKSDLELNEGLLAAIRRSNVKLARAPTNGSSVPANTS